jgi:cysteine synthase A
MKKYILSDVWQYVGKTPLVYLHLAPESGSMIAAKLEMFNPAGSIKDRMVLHILNDAEKRGLLKAGSTIIESTCGNTALSLAALCAARGYKLILTMPELACMEKQQIFIAFGAEIIFTPASEGMKGALKKAEELREKNTEAFLIQQFNNPLNPEAHFKTTAVEIWEDTNGEVDYLVAGIGTGGTISGISAYLKKQKPNVKIIGVEPESSPVISKGKIGTHCIPGIGAGFVPQIFFKEGVDEILTVSDKDAVATVKLIARKAGILAGISSGAAAFAALQIARRTTSKGKLIVVIFPDNGDKYFYTRMVE